MSDASASAPAPVDVAVLTELERDLAAVDEALRAIDAGDPARSPLLRILLAGDGPASSPISPAVAAPTDT